MLIVAAGALLVSLPSSARAQEQTACGPEIKAAVAAAIASVEDASDDAKAAVEKQLYAKYLPCGTNICRQASSRTTAIR